MALGSSEASTGGTAVSGAAPATDGAADAILSSVGTATYEWAVPSDRLSWSPNAAALFGVEDLARFGTGRAYAQLLAAESPSGRYEAVVNSPHVDRGDGVAYEIEYAVSPRPDIIHWIEDTGRWFASSDGRPLRAHGAVRIITDRYETRRRLIEASEIDPLTGQLSRHRFCEVLEEALDDAHKVRGSIGFIVAAVDNLAHVNDAYGFDIADAIIAAIGRRIRTRMRGGDLLGRLSGNKFGLLMRNCQPEDMAVAADRILAVVRDDVFMTGAGPIAVSVTMGGVIAPRHASSLAAMMGRAQEALDGVKARRRGAFQAYVPNLERDRQRRENLRVTDEIVAALNDRRVGLAFQPIVSAGADRRVSSYECLLRIRRSDGSLLPASTIVPLAEKLGLVRLIDARVLELAIAELAGSPALSLSINVSPATTMDHAWIRALEAQLRANPGAAGRLTVEITETSAIADVDETRRFVAKVQGLGCRVAIDDFGAGYTSFRNLRRLGVDCVKIDGPFVENYHRSEDDRHFVRTLLGLAQHMGLSTVAEWVPTEEVARELAALGCDYLQGDHTGAALEDRPWLAAANPVALRA
ncbi:MAG: phosphodiesterase [Phreatobacter sp.]|uniref:phosphodiesterase n=1 Tax=Phreatobacter sp. TaxID=1966341 RepID=UPI001A39FFFB|nr:phosphodiesterase [Phreatobacter sp.]MBL8568177.1 phosphodiesterase [Phreatobacter sp.]